MGNKVLYSAVVLDQKSKDRLIQTFKEFLTDEWKIICHHMTITLGELSDKTDIGEPIELTVESFGQSDKAMAVAVSGYKSKNAIPHITLAITNDGKPFDSNKITGWKKIEHGIKVYGIVTEITD